MVYDGFSQLTHASNVLKQTWANSLDLGKADFRSAFKTLPPSGSQRWLCWSLVFDPHTRQHMVAPLYSQALGSLGTVVAWFRAARLLQRILEQLFHIVVFFYVDDCFWVAPAFTQADAPHARWQLDVFEFVVTN